MTLDPIQEMEVGRFVPEPDLPLSPMQRAILAESTLEPAAARYNVPLAFAIEGRLDADRLALAVDAVVAKHEILRTVYPETPDGPVQAIADSLSGVLERVDMAAGADLTVACRQQAAHPFDLTVEPPIRARLFRAGPEHHALSLTFHHIAVDGWSIRLLLRDLSAAYAEGALGEAPLQYADWTSWFCERLEAGSVDPSVAAAAERCSAAGQILDLPERARDDTAGMLPFGLSPDRATALEAGAARLGVTLYTLLLGAYALAVGRLTGRDRLLIGTPVALRDRAEVQEVVGCFVNTVAIPVGLDRDATVADALRGLSAAVLDAMDAREAPLDRVARACGHRGGTFLRVFFNFDDAEVLLPAFGGAAVSVIDCDRGTAKFDLMLSMMRAEGEIRAGFDFAPSVVPPSDVDGLRIVFDRMLDRLIAAPDTRLRDLGVLGVDEAAEVLTLGRGPVRERPDDTVPERLGRIAAERPDAPALRAQGETLSFADYLGAAGVVASRLRAAGVRRGDRVLVLLPRGLALPVAMLGAMRAGAVYVPLEPDLPDARLRDIAGDALPAAILSIVGGSDRLHRVGLGDTPLIEVDIRQPANADAGVGPNPDDGAYMIYTSGSTGRPKGVLVSHRQALNYLDWAVDAYRAGAGDGTAVVTSTAFDATVLSFWAPLLAGKPVELLPEEGAVDALSAALAQGRGFGFVKMTPAHLDLLGELTSIAGQRDGAACFVIGGEALKTATVRPWLSQAPGIRLINEYGPTETVVGCCVHEAGPGDARIGDVPIGRPIDNTALYVLDEDLSLLPPGVAGELYIGGAGVAWGYWRRPELTAERFLADPFAGAPGARMYRTGDRVMMRADGVFEYLGRIDDQVKVRGYRIEPGEIEAALRALPGIRAAAVVDVGEGSDKRLVATVIGGSGDEAALKGALAERLPGYMVPDRIVAAEALPLTANGKVDRRALRMRALPAARVIPHPSAAVPDGVLARLVEGWSKALSVTAGPDTDFFEAGGTSLAAIRLLARLKREGIGSVRYPDLMAAPTPRALAAWLSAARTPALEEVLETARTLTGLSDLDADADLFEAGLTSLQAVRLVARLRRTLSADLPANAVHEGRTLRGIAEMLDTPAVPQADTSSPPVPSPAERQLWLDDRVEDGATRYVMQAAVGLPIPGPVSEERVRAWGRTLAERHPVLRSAYVETGGDLAVVPLPHSPAEISVREDAVSDGLIRRTARAEADRRFDLAAGLTWRLAVLSGTEETALVLTLHHIVSDAVSLAVAMRDLIALARGEGLASPPAADYRGYAAGRSRALAQRETAALAYWRDRLADAPAPLDLPTDRRRKPGHVPTGGAVPFAMSAAETGALSAFARSRRVGVQAVLCAAFGALLSRLSGASDLVLGIPVSERPDGHEDVVGLYLNTLPLRLQLGAAMSGDGLVAAAGRHMADLLGHGDPPLSRIVEVVRPPRVPGRTPLLHSVLDWRDEPGSVDADARVVPLDVATAPFDLAFSLRREVDGSIAGGLIFDAGLLDAETVAAWGRSFACLLRGLIDTPDKPVAELDMLDAQDRPRAMLEGPAVDETPDLGALIEAVLAAGGDRPALEAGSLTLTYGELRARTAPSAAAGFACIDTADPVARVLAAVAAIRAGGGFALIDPNLPAARSERMRRTIRTWEEGSAFSDPVPAYVQFTSGSTGEPKAAALPRSGLANLMSAIARELQIVPGARVLQAAAPAFDAWVWEVFTTLAGGGTLVVADRDEVQPGAPLAATLRDRRVSHVTLTPSAIAALGETELPDLRVLVSAGEALGAAMAERWARGRRLLNAYGPCEATVCATLQEYRPGDGEPTIGSPIAGMCAMVMDAAGRPAAPGAVGELWIAGLGVGLGYLGDPALTAERFLADPRRGREGRVYRTGDMVRVRRDGRLQFVGRTDRQVKVRGVRIELDEVEAALSALPGVEHAAATLVADADGRPALAAWVSGSALPDAARLRADLAMVLPETMLPAFLTVLDRMPMTATGKIDRTALPEPDRARRPGASSFADPLERVIATVAGEVLGIGGPIDPNASFFTLGGHSLLAVRFAALLSDRIGRPVPLPLLFANPSPAALAAALGSQLDACVLRTLRDGEGAPVYLVHAVDGTCTAYRPLAEAWPDGARVVAVEQGHSFADLATLAEAYAKRILDDLGDVAGPVRIVGWSLGAVIVAAVAQKLRAEGRIVLPVLIDAAGPGTQDETDIEIELAEAAGRIGAGAELIERVRGNVRLAATLPAAEREGAALLLRAADTDRPDGPADLGWSAWFSRVETATVEGTHHTVLTTDPAALAGLAEAWWKTQRQG